MESGLLEELECDRKMRLRCTKNKWDVRLGGGWD